MSEEEDFGFSNDIYQSFFQMTFEWPCLSFDVIRDNEGFRRRGVFPLNSLFVSATQAESADQNQLIVTKISGLQCTKNDDGTAEEDLPDPKINCVACAHPSTANRVRVMPQRSNIVSTWTEENGVIVWDVDPLIRATEIDGGEAKENVLFQMPMEEEGYGLCWSPEQEGLLAIGDCTGVVSLWQYDGSTFSTLKQFRAHADSVEDIQFSPTDPSVFATCSCDGYITVWDIRTDEPAMKFIGRNTASDPPEKQGENIDINVISWNRLQTALIASGSDDGQINVFDFRDPTSPQFTTTYHQDSITSIEWNPNDRTELAAACAEGRCTIWDLSVEALDPEEKEEGIPDQLMFEHVIADPKELHYHPLIPYLVAVTGGETFDVFIPDVDEGNDEEEEKKE